MGGTPGRVTDGFSGLLVQPRDVGAPTAALHRVLGDGELARRLGQGARDIVQSRFSRQAVAAQYAELYRELAGPGRAS